MAVGAEKSQIRKWLILILIVITSGSMGWSYTFTHTSTTPFDGQMKRVRPFIQSMNREITSDSLEIEEVDIWIKELHAMRYEFSSQWQTPKEVYEHHVADCKGKALVLYSMMKERGAKEVKLVIGKKDFNSEQPHAWLVWYKRGKIYILDPTLKDKAWALEGFRSDEYIAMYAYSEMQKYRVSDTRLLANKT